MPARGSLLAKKGTRSIIERDSPKKKRGKSLSAIGGDSGRIPKKAPSYGKGKGREISWGGENGGEVNEMVRSQDQGRRKNSCRKGRGG